MKYPEYVIVNGKKIKINTDFRVAIECNRIAEDSKITGYERALAIIYLLFGDAGLEEKKDYDELMKLALKFLSCGKEYDIEANKNPDMDFIEDYSYITTSFMSDYHINLDKEEMHWWKFMDLMNGLSNSEFGNCCILNRIRNLRNLDLSTIKDKKERDKIKEQKEMFALKEEKVEHTKEQKERANNLYKQLGIERK